MADQISPLSNNPERSLYSKLMLPAFGLALAAAPQALLAQGSCGGARAGTPACDTTHVKAPFAPTGWKTVAMDHFTMHAADPKKEAAYYQQLMNWKVRSADDKQIVMDIGDVGTVVILGGYVAPPPAPGRGGGGRGAAGGDSAGRAGRGGAGGRGAGGQAGGAARDPGPNPCTPSPRPVGGTQVAWDSYAWQITPWNAKNVEAELKKRGLNPVADNSGPAGYESFHVKDPDGFDVQISNGGYAKQRKASPAKGKLDGVQMPFEPTNWKTVWLDHLSFGVSNYKESYMFYQTLLGWKPTGDEGSQNETEICDDCGNTIIRGPNPLNPAFDASAPRRASIGHIAFGLEPFEADATKAELDKRSLGCRADTGGSLNIHDEAAKYKSYHTTTPEGFDLQISNATKARRTVR